MTHLTFKSYLLEGTRGAEKWDKYFAAQDSETIIKSDTALYDANYKKVGTIAKGEAITVLAGEYDSKPLISYDGASYRVSLNDIEKPTRAANAVKINLKPDALGLDRTISFSSLADEVKKEIDKSPDVDGEHAEFLKALVDHAADQDDTDAEDTLKDFYQMVSDDRAFISTVNNDFMEVLGPFFVAAQMPEYEEADVIFPSAGNEPLFDFEMEISDPVQFSSKKSGGRTNTLKVDHIWKAAKADTKLKRSHARELQFLELVATTPVKLAPQKINEWLKKTFPAYKLAKAPSTPAEITQLERDVVKWINLSAKMDFLPLIKDALPDLWYVKAKLNSDGTIKVEPIKSARDITKAELRSKNSPGHITDKVGFAV